MPRMLAKFRLETIDHVLFDCPAFASARHQLSAQLALHHLPLSFNVITGDCRQLSKSDYEEVESATASFLQTINKTRQI